MILGNNISILPRSLTILHFRFLVIPVSCGDYCFFIIFFIHSPTELIPSESGGGARISIRATVPWPCRVPSGPARISDWWEGHVHAGMHKGEHAFLLYFCFVIFIFLYILLLYIFFFSVPNMHQY